MKINNRVIIRRTQVFSSANYFTVTNCADVPLNATQTNKRSVGTMRNSRPLDLTSALEQCVNDDVFLNNVQRDNVSSPSINEGRERRESGSDRGKHTTGRYYNLIEES